MKFKLAITPALVTALTVTALAVHTGGSPAGAAVAAPWSLDAYGPAAGDNVVLKWNEQLLGTIRANPPLTGPTITSRALGILQTAEFDAWAAYDPVAKGTRLGSQLRRPAAERTAANKDKAISYAAYKVLVDLFGDPKFNRKSSFDAQMAALGYSIDGSDTSTPATIGNRAAQAVLDYRHADGSNQLGGYANTTAYQPVNSWDKINDPMRWQPLCVLTAAGVAAGMPPISTDGCDTTNYAVQKPLHPQWGTVVPFSNAVANYRVPGPPKDPDGVYSKTEVNQLLADSSGPGGTGLNERQKEQADYWADGPKSEFPPGHAFVFAQAVSRHSGYSLDQTVKLFFALGNAEMDAGIAAWYQKFKFDSIRPVSAIRYEKKGQQVMSWLGPGKGFGYVDGSQWLPYQQVTVVTPAFPEYVSGHSTFSSAGAKILQNFTGGDTFNASTTIKAGSSHIEPNTPSTDVTFTWPTFTNTLDDAGLSRRIGGIHFATGDAHGRSIGTQVGSYVWSKAQQYITGAIPG
jgi:hypothetical protein